jgi:hypothetical protein
MEHMLNRCRSFVAFAAFCALAHAEVKIFPSKTENPASYATYRWLPPRIVADQGLVENDPTYSPMIRAAIDKELAKKGYKQVPETGELEIVSALVVVKSSQLEGYLLQLGFDEFWGYSYVATAAPVTRVNREGALLFALVDPKKKASVWSGYITEALGKRGTAEDKLNAAAAKLLKKLPERK